MSGSRLLCWDSEVVRCLTMYMDWWQPSTSSVLQVGAARRGSGQSDGLRAGVIATLDERTELRCRVAQLEEKDRRILFLWYVVQLPVSEVARRLGLSQRQCQRLRARAVHRIVELGEDRSAEVA